MAKQPQRPAADSFRTSLLVILSPRNPADSYEIAMEEGRLYQKKLLKNHRERGPPAPGPKGERAAHGPTTQEPPGSTPDWYRHLGIGHSHVH